MIRMIKNNKNDHLSAKKTAGLVESFWKRSESSNSGDCMLDSEIASHTFEQLKFQKCFLCSNRLDSEQRERGLFM